MVATEPSLPGVLKLLSDSTRLRALALLERQELSVGELSRALGMTQSRVSNHLRIIREAGLLAERHAGTSTFVHLALAENGNPVTRLWKTLRQELPGLTEHDADLARLETVLAQRRTRDGEFFDRVAGEWDKIAGDFETGQARQRLAAHMMPKQMTIADLGCGTGTMAEALIGLCDRLICIDRSEAMLTEARKRLDRGTPRTAVEFRVGELDALPLDDASVDGVLCGMVLHHLAGIDDALAEMMRVLRPGASASVLELAPHRETWMREELGDRHLGLQAADIAESMKRAGFEDVALDPVDDRYKPRRPDGVPVELELYIVRGSRPR